GQDMTRLTKLRNLLPQLVATPVEFITTDFTAAAGILVATPLLVSFWNDGWYLQMASRSVNGDKCQIGRADVLTTVEQIVLYPNFYSDLHGRVEHAIDGGTQDNQVTDVHGNPEVQMVDGGSNHVVPAVAMRSHGAGK